MHSKNCGAILEAQRFVESTISRTLRFNGVFQGIILSGSPYSVYDKDAPHVEPAIFDLGVPILGICYGLQVQYAASWCIGYGSFPSQGNGISLWRQSGYQHTSRIWTCKCASDETWTSI